MFSLDFPRVCGDPDLAAEFRSRPEDFRVEEELGFEPHGEGEHVYLRIKKRGQNTQWLAQQLAAFARVKTVDVGYCGRKDRHAVTSQWFSIYDPQRKPIDWSALRVDGVECMQCSRHMHKLKPGQHSGNYFTIRLRNFCDRAKSAISPGELQQRLQPRLQSVAVAVPNYFGEQRFGRDCSNLIQAQNWIASQNQHGRPRQKDHKQRGMMLSAARSYLFNQVLAARVLDDSWNSGDVVDGPLWGRGRNPAAGASLDFENRVLASWSEWCAALEHVGLRQERRSLALTPREFQHAVDSDGLLLSFYLLPGQYATAVLREICELIPTPH